MKVYRVSKQVIVFMFVLLGFLTLIGLLILINGLIRADSFGILQVFLLIWLGLLVILWYINLKVPNEIKINLDNSLEFRSYLKKTVVSPEDIISIKAAPLSTGYVNLKHNAGTIRLFSHMTGFYELVGTIKSQNPGVEIKGC